MKLTKGIFDKIPNAKYLSIASTDNGNILYFLLANSVTTYNRDLNEYSKFDFDGENALYKIFTNPLGNFALAISQKYNVKYVSQDFGQTWTNMTKYFPTGVVSDVSITKSKIFLSTENSPKLYASDLSNLNFTQISDCYPFKTSGINFTKYHQTHFYFVIEDMSNIYAVTYVQPLRGYLDGEWFDGSTGQLRILKSLDCGKTWNIKYKYVYSGLPFLKPTINQLQKLIVFPTQDKYVFVSYNYETGSFVKYTLTEGYLQNLNYKNNSFLTINTDVDCKKLYDNNVYNQGFCNYLYKFDNKFNKMTFEKFELPDNIIATLFIKNQNKFFVSTYENIYECNYIF